MEKTMAQVHDHEACLAQALTEEPRCADLHSHGADPGVSRRGLLRAAGLVGAGTAALSLAPRAAAAAPADAFHAWRPDTDSPRFTLV